jgi:2-amino-4-hydroxy-6-hydroxymethyldihydropteridine diphosphokinase
MLDSRNAPVNVYLSAGSNIEPAENLRLACEYLEADYGELTLSSVYRNSAFGFAGDDFLNMVIGFSTCEKPEHIVTGLEALHDKANRQRHADPFSSRTLDLDLLLYGDRVCGKSRLPHEDIDKYGFVLGPLAEVAPWLRHPVTGKMIGRIWDEFDQSAHPMHQVEIGLTAAVAEII